MDGNRRRALVSKFSTAVIIQIVLSASSFLVGLILIRRTSNAEYGHYILITYAILLIVTLQNAFLQPSLVIRLVGKDQFGRANLIGGLLRGQQHVLLRVAGGALMLAAILWYSQLIDAPTAWLVFAGIVAASATLFREFFRMVLMTHHRPQEVLKADTLYVAVLVGGALLATLSPYPAIVAVITLSVAAGVGGLLLSRALWRFEAWNPLGKKATLAEIAPIGGWATVGAALHWAFSQGYNYLAAGMLSVASVGALASTRLLLTPLNLLSSGIGSLMLPTASQWLRDHGAETVFRRLLLVSGLLAGASLCYIGVIWYFRDWVFMHVLKKQFEDQDVLLIVWSAVFVLMLFRDQLLQLPSASGRFRQLAVVTAISTLIALTISYVAIRRFGVIGAPLGVLFGELSNLVGIGLLSAREIRDSRSIDKRTE